jgi:nucleoside-diphosphate-sugar epimerase
MPEIDELHVVIGTGPLGRAVVRELYSRGNRVRAINRTGKADFPASVEMMAGDLYDVVQSKQMCRGASVVYQCAMPPYAQWEGNFSRLQSNVIEAASQSGAKLIVTDNLYLYGEVDGPIHEALPAAATTKKGRIRAHMSETLFQAHQSGKIRMAIVRGSDFYGPYVTNSVMGERVFLPAVRGKKANAFGNIDLPHTYTYINDFGKALVTLGANDKGLGHAWHVPNAETLTTREFIRLVYETAGTPLKVSGMGRTMVRIGGLFVPEARETVEMMYEFDKPFVVDSRKYVESFGDHATPVLEAIATTVEWYKSAYDNKSRR